jgi:heme-degrading monooxygenase HmoA
VSMLTFANCNKVPSQQTLKYRKKLAYFMVKIVEMDENVTLKSQLEEDIAPVVLLNKFTVIPEDVDQFLKVFADATSIFKQQPGFISAQLHRGIGSSNTFFNYVVWESAKHFKQAFNRSEFRSGISDFLPNTTMPPHLFKIAVPGICEG